MSAAKPRDLGLTYEQALHGVQSAVAHQNNLNFKGDYVAKEFKHQRVGINSAHVSHAAIAQLLIEKGVFTTEEYMEMVRRQMNEELASYEEKYSPLTFR